MESICMEQELSIYNLEGKWNDYIGVQKEILQVLREQNDIVNIGLHFFLKNVRPYAASCSEA